ncbi:hypothetical protein OG500_33655 [Kitasatospora sp. NBC_01250]|uniref:hypothetical protein n=1 Tax=unclassified Kitasatospora TaxID=2633591 RepID=UPI002E13BAF9|nr:MULTISPECIES: hypothetical protein [unclassified Kitasatospora]WSJ70915.1 hypothetical protein OG294_35195 [Kitasatospora sp. NBC_01302]
MTSPDGHDHGHGHGLPPQATTTGSTGRAGLLDLRWILAALFTCYGAVLTVLGAAFTSAADRALAGGVNVNLWVGIGMLVMAAAFAGWARWRPISLPEPDLRPGPGDEAEPGHAPN